MDWFVVLERVVIEVLRSSVFVKFIFVNDRGVLFFGVLGRVCLKELVEEWGCIVGYDFDLDNCLGRIWSLVGL